MLSSSISFRSRVFGSSAGVSGTPSRLNTLRRWIVAITVAFVAYQSFLPPIVGLADQGDFARTIGRFGYGPEDKTPGNKYAFVPRKYVPDPSARVIVQEQVSSEYLFAGSAIL